MIALALRQSVHRNIFLTYLGALLILTGCQTISPQKKSPRQSTSATPAIYSELKPREIIPDDPQNWPQEFHDWFDQHGQNKNRSYTAFINRHSPLHPPLPMLYRSAINWEACGAQRYALPYYELWGNMPPTVELLNRLQTLGIFYDFEITSGYRSPELNTCVGGSSGSKHIFNAALDIRLLKEQATDEATQRTKDALCGFWKTEGEQWHMGLGLYPSGIIHIDTQGWRTWGSDYTWRSSFCQ